MNVYDFFDSIGLIIDSKIEKLNLDSTIICTIKDATKRSEGVYTVSYGTSSFQVNSADFTLEMGDSVYVGIPQGDYTNAYIISKRIEEVNKISEGSPFEGFVKELEIEGNISNISNDKIEVKWGNEEEQLIDYPFVNINNFTKLGISLTTNLKESNITDSFGIKLYFTSSRSVNGQEMYFMQTIDLDIGKKLGGIYIANTDIEIKQLFDISDIDNIIQFSAEVYNKSDSNIEYKNLKLYFGGMTADYTKEGLVLYTDKGVQYNTSEIKNIYLRWVYKENEEYKIITSLTPQEDIPKNVKINWYYNNSTDKYAENVWFIQTKPLNIYKDLESYEAQIEYNTIEAESPISIKAKINFESINDNKNIFLKSDEIKLTGYKTEFDDLYHPDGTIIDFALVKDPNKYQVFLNNSPFAKGVYDIDISFEMLYKIPRSKTGLGIGKIPKDFQELETTDEAFYYYKKVLPQTEAQNGVQKYAPVITDDLNFIYSVNDFYMPSYNNNSIICEIIALYKGEEVERFSRSLDIKFHRSGICKTDFVLYPKLTDETGEPTRSIRYYQGILNVSVELCDATGNLLEITQDVEWSWYGREGEDTELQIKKINKNQCQITPKDSLRIIDIQNKNYAYVLHASYKTKKANQVNTRVECLIPIGINTSAQITKDEATGNLVEGIYNFQYIGGPTIINYNSNGGEPSFYSTNYRLLTSDLEEHFDMNWICKIPVGQHTEEKTYYPHLENREEKYYLVAPSLYTKGTEVGVVIIALLGSAVEWIQPLVSYQSTSFSSFINDWDGKLLIDENEGTAMAARLGAGVKDENGKFSGVLLGEWQTKVEDGSWTSKTGLYGYDKGEQSYGFREDGTAFMGKSGAGRIEFDGNEGVIQSANFDGDLRDPKNLNYGQNGTYLNLRAGTFVSNDVYLRGNIGATSGNIGGWKIEESALVSEKVGISSKFSFNSSKTLSGDLIETIDNNRLVFKCDKIDDFKEYLITNNYELVLAESYHDIDVATQLLDLFSFGDIYNNKYGEINVTAFLDEVCCLIQVLDFSQLDGSTMESRSDGATKRFWESALLCTTIKSTMPRQGGQYFYYFCGIISTVELIDWQWTKMIPIELSTGKDLGTGFYYFPKKLQEIIITSFNNYEKAYTGVHFVGFQKITLLNQGADTKQVVIDSSNCPFITASFTGREEGNIHAVKSIEIYGNFLIQGKLFQRIKDKYNIENDLQVLKMDYNVIWKNIPSAICENNIALQILSLPKIEDPIGIDAFAGCINIETPLILMAANEKENIIPNSQGDNSSPHYFSVTNKVPYILMSINIFKSTLTRTAMSNVLTNNIEIPVYCYMTLDQLINNENYKGKYYTQDGIEEIIFWAGKKDTPKPLEPAAYMITETGKIIVNGKILYN